MPGSLVEINGKPPAGKVGELLVIPFLKAHRAASGNLVLTEKFLSGMQGYAERWPGKVTAMVGVGARPDSNLDHVEVEPGRYPFQVEEAPGGQEALLKRMRQADVVSGGPLGIKGVRQAVVKETTLRTRLQIIAAEAPDSLRRWKRSLTAVTADLRERHLARRLAGIQCNGTPTYDIYRRLHPNAMLFFDSRIGADDLVAEELLDRRTAKLLAGGPLRLAFTGRLIRIKGVTDLPKIAVELGRLGVRFKMSICGGGECERQLAEIIREQGLEELVCLTGVLPYREKLLPLVRENVDLFVCTHVQGDPSCSYLETMACGVPIVGYENEAWKGMAPLSGAGWVTPLNDPGRIAARIAKLDRDRPALVRSAKAAREFAGRHLFERTMDRRVEHLLLCRQQAR